MQCSVSMVVMATMFDCVTWQHKGHGMKKFLQRASNGPAMGLAKGKMMSSESSLSKPFSDDDTSSHGSRDPTLTRGPNSEPMRRAQRVYFQEPALEKPRGGYRLCCIIKRGGYWVTALCRDPGVGIAVAVL